MSMATTLSRPRSTRNKAVRPGGDELLLAAGAIRQPHPVRGYFNDPRISGRSKAFHFGIDISAPNGTAVFAVEAGTVHLEDPRAISVVSGGNEFGYWHVVPAVQHHQEVARHQLLGHVEAPWLHVHFAERRGRTTEIRSASVRSPHGGTTPVLTSRGDVLAEGDRVSPDAVHGAVDVIAEAHDTPPDPVPAPWNDLPVTPVRLRWRVLRTPRPFGPGTRRSNSGRLSYRARVPSHLRAGTRQNHAETQASIASTSPTPGARPPPRRQLQVPGPGRRPCREYRHETQTLRSRTTSNRHPCPIIDAGC